MNKSQIQMYSYLVLPQFRNQDLGSGKIRHIPYIVSRKKWNIVRQYHFLVNNVINCFEKLYYKVLKRTMPIGYKGLDLEYKRVTSALS